MGKLQIKRGTTVPTLNPGEPFLDATGKLHIGKNDGSGNQQVSETGATIKTKLEALTGDSRLDANAIKNLPEGLLVEWVLGATKPTIECDRQIGDFVEGKMHFVTTQSVGSQVVVIVRVANYAEQYSPKSFFNSDITGLLSINNKMIVVGAFDGFIKRLNEDGSLDETFVNYAPILYPKGVTSYKTGYLVFGTALVYFNADGTINDSLSALTFPINPCEQIVVDSNNKIVAITQSSIFKYNEDGSIDETFSYTSTGEGFSAIAIQSDNKIVICEGTTIKRLNSDGSLDETFVAYTNTNNAMHIFVQNDGKIVIDSTLKRLNSDGSLDETFSSDAFTYELCPVSNGQFIIVNLSVVKRINSDGSLDETFLNLNAGDVGGLLVTVISDYIYVTGDNLFTRLNSNGSEYAYNLVKTVSYISSLESRISILEQAILNGL